MFDELQKLLKEVDVIKDTPRSFILVCLLAAAIIWAIFHERLELAREDTTHWHETSDNWRSRSDYYQDLLGHPVQKESSALQGELPAATVPTPVRPGPPKPKSTEKTGIAAPAIKPVAEPAHEPKQQTEPPVSAPNGVAIGRDNNGTAIVNNVGSLPRTLSPAQQSAITSRIGSQPSGFTGITCLLGDQEGCGFATQLMNVLRGAGWKIGGLDQSVMSEHLEGIFVAVSPEDTANPPDGVLQIYNVIRAAGVAIQGLRMNGTPAGKFGILVAAHTKS
jgi:hypothetical protein